MKFEYPFFFYGFFFLAIPILIHLFNFRKYKTLYFSSLLFLKQIDQETKSTQKLKHILVLISRLLLFSALIFAFAQPYVPLDENKNAGAKPVLAIYLDNSFSMSLIGTDGELLSEAREQARQFIENSSEETSILLLTNEMDGVEQRFVTKADAIDRLDKIKLSPLRRDISSVVNWINDVLQNYSAQNGEIGTTQVVLLSDYQKNSFGEKGLKADSTAYFYPIVLNPQEASNIYIDSVWFESPNFKKGVNNELNIRVKNASKQNMTNVELQLDVNGSKRDVFLDIPANDKVITTINYSDTKSGKVLAKASVNDKQFLSDDDFYFSYSVREKTSVLIVNGSDAVSNIEKVYNLDAFYEVKSVSEKALTQDLLKNADLIVLNGIEEISTGLNESLVSFTNNGGSVALFPAEKSNLSSYNSLLQKWKMPLMGNLMTEGNKLQQIQYNDLFFQGVFEKKPELLNLPLLKKSFQTKAGSGNALSVLKLQNGNSLLVRSTTGANVFLFASSLSPNVGNFTSNALFSTILLRMGELSHRKLPLYLTIGSDSRIPMYNVKNVEKPIVLKNENVEFIPRSEQISQIAYISLAGIPTNTIKAGNYNALQEEINVGVVSLNYDRKESEIEFLSATEINDAFLQAGIKNVSVSSMKDGQELSRIDLDKPIEYWRIFVLLAILFVFVEMLLLKFLK
jgi:hypothetical protein